MPVALDNNLWSCSRRGLASVHIPAGKKQHVVPLPVSEEDTSPDSNSFTVGGRNLDVCFWGLSPTRVRRLRHSRSDFYGHTCSGSVFIWKILNLSGDSTANARLSKRLHIKDFFISTPSLILPKHISPLNLRHGLIRF